jgi:saccharopine dehydrogenase-like NADP-dependent oxidoreductase
MQITDARKIYNGPFMNQCCSAIQITTAASLCAVVDLYASGMLPGRGFIRQEQVSLDDFLANRFGRAYASDAQDLAEKVSARSGVGVKQ